MKVLNTFTSNSNHFEWYDMTNAQLLHEDGEFRIFAHPFGHNSCIHCIGNIAIGERVGVIRSLKKDMESGKDDFSSNRAREIYARGKELLANSEEHFTILNKSRGIFPKNP